MQYGGESREKSPGFFADAEEPFPKRKDFSFDAGNLTWQDAIVLFLSRSVSLLTEHALWEHNKPRVHEGCTMPSWTFPFGVWTGTVDEQEGEASKPFYSCDRGSAWQDGSCVTQLHPARLGAPLLSGKRRRWGGKIEK